jgi:DNA polymerase-3 subunit chi
MTEVLFVEVTASRLEFKACEIAERTYSEGRRLQIIAANQEQAARLDDLLWTFKPDSFVPHGFSAAATASPDQPVVITTGLDHLAGFEALLMMDYCPGDLVKRFVQAIHLVVIDNPERLDASRRYWAQLKDTGFALRHQKI